MQATQGEPRWLYFVIVALLASHFGCGHSNGKGDPSASLEGGVQDGSAAQNDAGIVMPSATRPTLPAATGSCPTFKAATLKFSPAGQDRTARVWMDEQADKDHDGPVVFYWYGTFVGAVATNEIVACAEKEIGIDERHIHSVGMSAGGLFTSALSFARPNLFASMAVYSGGSDEIFAASSSNKFAAMVFYGGPSDNVFGKDFKMSSEAYAQTLRTAGHFVLLCDHNTGHNLPPGREAAVVPFFLAHPYGADSPYRSAFPAGVPIYCRR